MLQSNMQLSWKIVPGQSVTFLCRAQNGQLVVKLVDEVQPCYLSNLQYLLKWYSEIWIS